MIESLQLIVSGNLFHREMACGKNECLYTSVLNMAPKFFFLCTLYMSCVVFSCSGISYKQVVSWLLYLVPL